MKRLVPLLLFACCAAGAQQTEANRDAAAQPGADAPAVEVANLRNPVLKSYKTMLAGADVYERMKARAPNTTLRFRLLAPDGAPAKPFTLRIANDETSVGVPVEANGTFALPRLPELSGDAELIVNAKKGSVRWTPDIRPAGEPDTVRRLGDLRLECEVWWIIEQEDMGFFRRKLMQAVGSPCASKMSTLFYEPGRKVSGATLEHGGQRTPLKIVRNGYAFILPLQDKSLADAAEFVIEYAEP
jgi:hypothetical protein